jgi:allantoin racemase
MKILVINGNTSDAMTEDIGMVARMYARPDTEITAISPSFGPRSIEGHFEEYIAAAAVIEEVAKHRDEYDAFILACYSDPGLYACREITDKPVLGIAESSMHLASMLGHKFTIVSVLPRVKPLLENLVRQVGLESKCASVRCTDLTVLEIEEDPDRAVRELTEEARRAVAEDGAEVICLGCAGMGPLDKRIQEAVGAPVLDGTVSAVKMAEALYDYGLTTSKVAAFAWPEKKEFVNVSPIIQEVANATR